MFCQKTLDPSLSRACGRNNYNKLLSIWGYNSSYCWLELWVAIVIDLCTHLLWEIQHNFQCYRCVETINMLLIEALNNFNIKLQTIELL